MKRLLTFIYGLMIIVLGIIIGLLDSPEWYAWAFFIVLMLVGVSKLDKAIS